MGFYVKEEPAHLATEKAAARTLSRARKPQPRNAWPPILTVGIGHRFYSPSLGRWLSRDPLAETPLRGVESQDLSPLFLSGDLLNLYPLCRNNPVRHVDGLGLFTVGECTIVIFWGHDMTRFFQSVEFESKTTSAAIAITCNNFAMNGLLKQPVDGYYGIRGDMHFQLPLGWKYGGDSEQGYIDRQSDRGKWWRDEMKKAFEAAVKHARRILDESCCPNVQITTHGPVVEWWNLTDPMRGVRLDTSMFETEVP